MNLSKNILSSTICLAGSIIMSFVIRSMYDTHLVTGYIVTFIFCSIIGIFTTFVGWRDLLRYILWMILFFVAGFVVILLVNLFI